MTLLQRSLCIAAPIIGAIGLLTGCGPRDTTTTAVDDKHVLTLTKANFQSEVLASPQPVLVDFWATWCGPCKMVAPIVAELAAEFEGRIKVGKVDVDIEEELSKQYEISAIPALLIFKDGKVVDQVVGARGKAELKAMLQKYADAAPQAAPLPKS